MKIPQKFWKGENQPIAENVGELKKILSELPDELPIERGFGGAPKVVVYNHGYETEHLEFEEND